MPIVDISPVGSIGIITDLPSHEIPPEAWTAGHQVRMKNGGVEARRQNSGAFTPVVSPYNAMHIVTPSEQYWIYAGLNDVYDTDGNVHTLISALGGYNATADINWSMMQFNGVPILNNGVERPQMQAPSQRTTQLTDLLNWPGNLRARVLRPFGNFLVALDTADAGTRNPYNVRWSDPAGPGAVPDTWDIADPTKRAGERTIAEHGGFVIDCLPLGNTNVIYKEDAIWGMRFIGGTLVFQFGELFRGKGGILSRRCVAEFRRRHFVVTKGDVLVHDGNSIDSVIDSRRRRELFSTMDEENSERTFVFANHRDSEIWICAPRQGEEFANTIMVWNWRENSWGQIGLQNAAALARGVVETVPSPIIDNVDVIIDQYNQLIDGSRLNPAVLENVFMRPISPDIRKVDDISLLGVNSYVERTGLALVGRNRNGAPKVDLNRIKFLRGVIPRFGTFSGGTIGISAGYQNYPGGPVTWAPEYQFNPATDRVAPFLGVSGKLLAVKFNSTGDLDWRLDGYQLDIELGGTA